ncbi:unnamed protein product [Calypogeia fissa]
MTSSWKMVTHLGSNDKPRLNFDCAMVFARNFLYAVIDGELLDRTDGRRLWNIVKIHAKDDCMGDTISPPQAVVVEQQLHTIQKPQLVVYHDNLWLIVEGLLNWTFCFYELKLDGATTRDGQSSSEWTFVKQISRDLFGGTLVVLHQCIALQELIYFRVFDIIPEGSAQLIMLVYDAIANAWCFLNDPRGLDGRYFLYHTFVFEPSLDALI